MGIKILTIFTLLWFSQLSSVGAMEWSPLQVSLWGDSAQIVSRDKSIFGLKLNAPYGINKEVMGLDIGVAGDTNIVNGLQANLIRSWAAMENFGVPISSSHGFQIAGLGNIAARIIGIQGAGLVNRSKEMDGVQIAGFINDADNMHGIQLAPINVGDNMNGIQFGILNYAKGYTGVRLGCLNFFEGSISGLQIGLVNNHLGGKLGGTDEYSGVQIGLSNKAHILHGLQIGFINIADTLYGFQIGVVNIAKNGQKPFGILPWTHIINFAF
jgi:hypothetical protein